MGPIFKIEPRKGATSGERSLLFRILIWKFAIQEGVALTSKELGLSPRTVEAGQRRIREALYLYGERKHEPFRKVVRADCFTYSPQYPGSPKIKRPGLLLLLDPTDQARVFFIGGRTNTQTTPIILENVAQRTLLITNGSRRWTELESLKYYLDQVKVGRWGNCHLTHGAPRSPSDFFEGLRVELGKVKGLTDRTFKTRVQEYVFRWNTAGWSRKDRFLFLVRIWNAHGWEVIDQELASAPADKKYRRRAL